MLPSYLNTLMIYQDNQTNDKTSQIEPNKIKEKISGYAEKIINQPTNAISSDDVESFIKEIYIMETNIQKAAVQIPISVSESKKTQPEDVDQEKICRKIEKAAKKLFERELMALDKSISENAVSRHEKNILFLESFMSWHHMKGNSLLEGSSRQFIMIKKAVKLLYKISIEPINEISNYEVDRIVEIGSQCRIRKTVS